MGVDARMLVKTMSPLSAERVRELSVKLVEAFGKDVLFIIKPGEFDGWHPNGRHALEIVEVYEQDGPNVCAKPGQQLIEVHLCGRYYGPGYERGSLPDYAAVAGWLEHHIAGCEVWYGGDSSGICVEPFGEEQRRLAMLHFYEVGHAPYRGYFDEKPADAPRCDFCRTTMIQNGYGPAWRAWYCAGCGQAIEERDGVRSVRKDEKE